MNIARLIALLALLVTLAPSVEAQGGFGQPPQQGFGQRGGFGQQGAVVQPGGFGQQGYAQPVVMQSGGGGWPALGMARPEGELNPHLEEVSLNYDFLGPGITFFIIGYLTSVITSSNYIVNGSLLNGVGSGYYPGAAGQDGTCHDVMGGLGLIPILGPILGMIVVGACSVPAYAEVEDSNGSLIGYRTDGSVPLTYQPGHFGYLVPAAIFQLVGLGLAIPGLLQGHQSLAYASNRTAGPQVSFAASAPGAEIGLSFRLTH